MKSSGRNGSQKVSSNPLTLSKNYSFSAKIILKMSKPEKTIPATKINYLINN